MNKKPYRAITDEEKEEEAKAKAELEHSQYIEDLKRILSTKEGKRFFNKFFSDSMIFETTFTGDSKTFFKEGARNVGLRIFSNVIEARPDLLLELATKKGSYHYE